MRPPHPAALDVAHGTQAERRPAGEFLLGEPGGFAVAAEYRTQRCRVHPRGSLVLAPPDPTPLRPANLPPDRRNTRWILPVEAAVG
jgi:hypothetical protein